MEDKYKNKKYYNEPKGEVVVGYKQTDNSDEGKYVGVYELPYLRCGNLKEILDFNIDIQLYRIDEFKDRIAKENCMFFIGNDSGISGEDTIYKVLLSEKNIEGLLNSGRFGIKSLEKFFDD